MDTITYYPRLVFFLMLEHLWRPGDSLLLMILMMMLGTWIWVLRLDKASHSWDISSIIFQCCFIIYGPPKFSCFEPSCLLFLKLMIVYTSDTLKMLRQHLMAKRRCLAATKFKLFGYSRILELKNAMNLVKLLCR